MDTPRLIDSLERFGAALPAVVGGVAADDARWRGDGGAWSVLEIVTHLADEEVEDFRRRVEFTLRDPAEAWPPIAPEAWAVERGYNDRDLATELERFVTERRTSVAWLRALDAPDWERTYQHPSAGAIRAGDVLAAWTAHDALHLRQIAKRLYQLTRRDAAPYVTDYAGPWSS